MAPTKSEVWNYFTRINNKRAQRNCCTKSIHRTAGNTSNLKLHLVACHNVDDQFKSSNKLGSKSSACTSEFINTSGQIIQIREDKLSFVYDKLVVPSRMRSRYWNCFGFPANEEGKVITRKKIICVICKAVFVYSKNTSNLKNHLQHKHPQELVDLELQILDHKTNNDCEEKNNSKVEKSFAPEVHLISDDGGVILNTGSAKVKCEPNISVEEINSLPKVLMRNSKPKLHGEQLILPHGSNIVRKGIFDAVSEYIVKDLQSPDIVEMPGFQNFLVKLRSPCGIPNKIKLTKDIIPSLYESYKESLKESLHSVATDLVIGIEEWMPGDSQTYITFTAHYLLPEYESQLQSKVLLTRRCSVLYDIELWCHLFDKLLTDWQIKQGRIKAIIYATDQQNLLSALREKGFALIPCLLYSIQQVCMKCCFTIPVVINMVEKVRILLSLIYNSNLNLITPNIPGNMLQLEDFPCLDYPKIWISTYNMLEQLLASRSVINEIFDVIDATACEKKLIKISDEDWSVVEDVVRVLEPFKITLTSLAEEKTPLISLLKPLIWQLLNVHLKVHNDSESNLSKQLKLNLFDVLKEKYTDESVTKILKTATTLDPRFKQFPCAAEEGGTMLLGPIKEELITLIKQDSKDNDKERGTSSTSLVKNNLSGISFLLGGLCSQSNTLSVLEKADLEISHYECESAANLDSCPLTWWQNASQRFPYLSQLASNYLCVPATVIPANRISVENQISYDIRRCKIASELTDKLLFLNGNGL